MTSHNHEHATPATAEELFNTYPGITVVRDRLGPIYVEPTPQADIDLQGFRMVVQLGQFRGQVPGSGLSLESRLLSTGLTDTVVTVPTLGSAKEAVLDSAGIVHPQHVIRMAQMGVELLHGLHRLPAAQRQHYPAIPEANDKIYDHAEFPEPDISAWAQEGIPQPPPITAAFAVAKLVLLGIAD